MALVVREELHPQFKRKGNDLLTRVEVPLVQALTSNYVEVPLLDGDTMEVPLFPISATSQPSSRIAVEHALVGLMRPNQCMTWAALKAQIPSLPKLHGESDTHVSPQSHCDVTEGEILTEPLSGCLQKSML